MGCGGLPQRRPHLLFFVLPHITGASTSTSTSTSTSIDQSVTLMPSDQSLGWPRVTSPSPLSADWMRASKRFSAKA